jgi:hypothetical protein
MASKDRQAEETRIRRALEINSFDLTTLEHHLMENDCIPDSSDEQAARDAAFRFRKNYTVNTFPVGSNLRNGLFAASENAFELDSDACVRESESVKYDAVMLAVRKAQTSAAQQQKDSRGSYAVVKQERA